MWCGQALKPGATEVADTIESRLLASIKEDDLTTEEITGRVELLEQFRGSPEVRAALVDRLADELMT